MEGGQRTDQLGCTYTFLGIELKGLKFERSGETWHVAPLLKANSFSSTFSRAGVKEEVYVV